MIGFIKVVNFIDYLGNFKEIGILWLRIVFVICIKVD